MSVSGKIMSLQDNNLLKQLPFYGKTIKPGIKEFTNGKLLSELPVFEKPIKAKIKQSTTKKLLQEQSFYKQPIKKLGIKKLKNYELLRELPFYDDINILRKEKTFKQYAETYDIEIIQNKNLSNSLVISKPAIKYLFSDLLRDKNAFKYVLTAKISLKKHVNNNEPKDSIVYFHLLIKTIINRRYHLNNSFEEILNLLRHMFYVVSY